MKDLASESSCMGCLGKQAWQTLEVALAGRMVNLFKNLKQVRRGSNVVKLKNLMINVLGFISKRVC